MNPELDAFTNVLLAITSAFLPQISHTLRNRTASKHLYIR